MQHSNQRGHIRLIYSSTEDANVIVSNKQTHEDQWGQFELFTSEKPDVLIFAQPNLLSFEGIVDILSTGHARRIFDLRTMPYISFGNQTRDRFLKLLVTNKVDYYNLFKLKNILQSNPNDFDFDKDNVNTILKPMIEKGPTVIFSDNAPSEDKVVKKLVNSLATSKIKFSTYYAEN